MSRLIDADALIKRLWEQHKGIQVNADMYTNADEVAEEVCNLVSFIDEQPTAYDIEKVVAELHEFSLSTEPHCNEMMRELLCTEFSDCDYCKLQGAIEIVRKGSESTWARNS